MNSSSTPTAAERGRNEAASRPSTAPWAQVALREMQVRLTDKTFLVSTLLMLVVIVGTMAFNAVMADRSGETTVAVVSSEGQHLVEAADHAPGGDGDSLAAQKVADEQAAEHAVSDGDADVALVQRDGRWTLLSEGKDGSSAQQALGAAVSEAVQARNARDQGVDLHALRQGSQLETRMIEGSDDAAQATILSFAFVVVFYIASLLTGPSLAGSVLEEKQNRVVEIIATAVPVHHVLIGKLVANLVLALGQLLLYALTALVAMNVLDVGLEISWVFSNLGWFLVFFLLGLTILAALYAVIGSMGDRVEDLSASQTPLMMLVFAVFGAGFLASGTVETVLSYVPVFSTVMMPTRLMEGHAQWWEGVVAAGIAAVALVLVLRWATSVYRRAVMRTGTSFTWGQLLRNRI